MKNLSGILRKILVQIALIAGLSALSVSASASLIQGDFAYGGGATQTGDTLNFAFVYADGTGDLAGVTDIILSPLVIPDPGGALSVPTTIWTDASNSLNYFRLESGLRTDAGSANESITLAGLGTVFLENFTPTEFSWSFSYDAADGLFFFSASQVSAVPEPGTLALFGIGLVGAGLARRRRNQSA